MLTCKKKEIERLFYPPPPPFFLHGYQFSIICVNNPLPRPSLRYATITRLESAADPYVCQLVREGRVIVRITRLIVDENDKLKGLFFITHWLRERDQMR